ncbi:MULTISPECIES: ATP-dependent Clp protease proteolytic subunit [Serratia]|jgi:ATP-dependent Clp protease protease subunit|uniref:ATP-dependent Clp protease proteolytic subunit n=1 Tax=Serratia fonticola TaxID=47917 RepID=A0AAP2B6N6_SERFO|nr:MULTISPECIES: ATP-dependent Clp protease proteolytic subunit [Serratia]ALX94530.1 ATP-dependent Clp protease proteolytic subunit [Serratia fonticola]MBC3213792.1 ATP-dependent Clp protease proteolytic subunit [Serratia fonticola]MBP0995652.1 ATP-dependent Clp protease proteolytic subunit [Serratia fonticola]MBP1000930.1 ATP-dependent Clp protease proteolytic subunit [Serratia fonticola]MBP1010513.1 ATP-dependent Clp protease proteolytic subunit [Serratia fonticola]
MAEKTAISPPQRDGFLDERTFKSRTILLFGEINDTVAYNVVKQLVALSDEACEPINFLICSPGGHVESGDVIHDVVRFISAPVNMIGSGWVGSAAVNVFLAVPKERRFCLTNTRFLIHQPSGGIGGQATDVALQAREIIRIRERIAALIASQTGQKLEKVLHDIERDFWMPAAEAIDYGLVSKVIVSEKEIT